MERGATPLETLLMRWQRELEGPDQLLSRVERDLKLQLSPELVRTAADASALARAIKEQVDHPGGLERLAERLLRSQQRPPNAVAVQKRAGASW